jgi:tripartite-type tricarboxylate transporter receptor subunit TctC
MRVLRIATALLSALVFSAASAGAQTYPTNKITLVVAFAPGGVADTVARFIGQGLSERLHQNVVVENRGGAGGNIAAAAIAAGQPDGYTLLVTTTAVAINETLRETKQFSALDLTTVAIAASSPEVLVTSPSNPANNLADLIKAAQSKPVNYGSAGVGSGSHIEAEYFFKILTKAPVAHIPFQGGAPAMNATLGNQIDVWATTLGGGAAAQIAAGKLKGLAVADNKRASVIPNVATFAEQGFANYVATSWVGVFAPAKTDAKIVATLNDAINATINSAEIREKLTAIGFDPIVGTPAQADSLFKAEVDKWGKMVKALGISVK